MIDHWSSRTNIVEAIDQMLLSFLSIEIDPLLDVFESIKRILDKIIQHVR